ncbi:AIP3-domain-containing protein [Meredithblackwellia eburnea MCA 4105]
MSSSYAGAAPVPAPGTGPGPGREQDRSVVNQNRSQTTLVRGGSNGGTSVPTSHMDSTITRLLIATKQLLEGLAKWSRGEVTDDAISAIYVKLGNDFNVACAAFAKENIGMSELLSVPTELRVCLESCLSDPPSQATLERHLPKVRQIIIGLLTGLREKQRLYRDGVAAKRERERSARRGSTQTQQSAGGGYSDDRRPSEISIASSTAAGTHQPQQQQPQQSLPQRSQTMSNAPITPNSASRSREELRKFVSQAQSVAPPPPPPIVAKAIAASEGGSSATGAQTQQRTSTSSLPPGSGAPPPFPPPNMPPPTIPAPRNEADYYNSNGSKSPGIGLPSGGPRPRQAGRTTSLDESTAPPSTNPVLQRKSSQRAMRASEGGAPLSSSSASPSVVQQDTTTRGGSGVYGSPPPTLASSSHRFSSERSSRGPPPFSPPPPAREWEEPIPVPSTPTHLAGGMVGGASGSSDLYPQSVDYSPAIGSPSVSVRPPSMSIGGVTLVDEPFTPTIEGSQNAAQLESLEALKQSDNLTRRASKRYSAYAINKMTGGSGGSPARGGVGGGFDGGRSGGAGGGGGSMRSAGRELSQSQDGRGGGPVRRTKSEFRTARGVDGERVPLPPVPTLPGSSSAGDLRNAIIEEEPGSPALNQNQPQQQVEQEPSHKATTRSPGPRASTSSERLMRDSLPAPPTSQSAPNVSVSPPLPPPPISSSQQLSPTQQPQPPPPVSSNMNSSLHRKRESTSETEAGESEMVVEYPIHIFIQIGRNVKKVRLDSAPSIADLRVLFIERFQYNPGHADFPDIYLRDPAVGVQYELEDMSELKNGSVISLNIDSVEQVKQHIDHGLAGLTQEIKELRSTVTAIRRTSVTTNNAVFSPIEIQASPVVPRPSERQFQDAAQKVIKSKQRLGSIAAGATPPDGSAVPPPPPTSVDPSTPISPTSSAGADLRALHVVGTLKTQHEEVQNLRREIGVLRQVYVDFAGQTKTLLGNLRAQTTHVQTIAATKVSSQRAFVEAGKQKLETETTELIARGDTLQDAIDDMRNDISIRRIRPRPAQIAEIGAGLRSVRQGRDDLVKWISTVKPTWKTTWSEELETIINEQKLLEAQEGFLSELEVDLEEAASIFANIEQVAKQPKTGRTRDFTPAVDPSGGGDLSNVLLEVRGLQPDANRRLEAIEKAEKARQLDLASRTDEFADELGGFVAEGKLRKSGGIEETERLRQAKSEATLRAMFNPIS